MRVGFSGHCGLRGSLFPALSRQYWMKTLLIRAGALGDTALSLFAAQWLSSAHEHDVTVMVQSRHIPVANLFGFDAVSEEECDFQSAFSTPSSRLVDALKPFDSVIAIKKDTGNLRMAINGQFARIAPLPSADCALPYPMFVIHGAAEALGIDPPETLPRLEPKIKWVGPLLSHCESFAPAQGELRVGATRWVARRKKGDPLDSPCNNLVRDRHGRQRLPHDDISTLFQQPAGHLVFAVGSGSLTKNWPLHNFIRLIELARSNGFDKFTAIIGPAEMERDPAPAKSLAAISGVCALIAPSLHDLADEIAGASVFVGADSGVTHLASLIQAPTVALFGPSNPVVWGPVGARVAVIQAPSKRMDDITVESVIGSIICCRGDQVGRPV
jgi:hypothetical protein